MSDDFVPLALFLRPNERQPPDEPTAAAAVSPIETLPQPPQHDEALRAARRFHAALAEALEAALQELLRAVAREVLARELRLGGADVAGIVATALDRFREERILLIRAHPQDCAAVAPFPIEHVADGSLMPGEIRLDLQYGTIDLTFEARLDAALAAWAA